MKPPKILFVGNYFHSKRVWEEIPERLQTVGYSVLTTSSRKSKILRLFDMALTVLTKRQLFDFIIMDVFSGASFFWAELIGFLLIFLKKSYLLVLRGGGLAEFSSKYPKRVASLLNKADFVVTPSQFLLMKLSDMRQDIIYIPNGLDLDQFQNKTRLVCNPLLIWVRALHQIYQPEVAVKAINLLRQDYPEIRLLLLGEDKKDGTKENILRLVDDFRLVNSVNWIGFVPRVEVPLKLQTCDIFLNTTLYEGFGTSLVEAAACGLCIVTTNVGELSYLWEDGFDALLVPPNDPKAMAAAVKRILEEPGLAEKLSRNARKKAEKFDWGKIIPQWEAVIEEVISHA